MIIFAIIASTVLKHCRLLSKHVPIKEMSLLKQVDEYPPEPVILINYFIKFKGFAVWNYKPLLLQAFI